jgi:hypothetical protein
VQGNCGDLAEKRQLRVMVRLPSVLTGIRTSLEAVVNRIVPALAAAPVLALALVVPVHAAEAAQVGGNGYILRVHGLTGAETREATLVCDPVAAGTHPRAEEACEAIAEAGSIAGAKGEEHACPFVYDPVVAVAYGTENYREEFANECVLMSEKGVVFDF